MFNISPQTILIHFFPDEVSNDFIVLNAIFYSFNKI